MKRSSPRTLLAVVPASQPAGRAHRTKDGRVLFVPDVFDADALRGELLPASAGNRGALSWSTSPFVFGTDAAAEVPLAADDDADTETPKGRRLRAKARAEAQRAAAEARRARKRAERAQDRQERWEARQDEIEARRRAREAARRAKQPTPEERAARAARARETAAQVFNVVKDVSVAVLDTVATTASDGGDSGSGGGGAGGEGAADGEGAAQGAAAARGIANVLDKIEIPTTAGVDDFGMSLLPDGFPDDGAADSFDDAGFDTSAAKDLDGAYNRGDVLVFGEGALATAKALLWPTAETWEWWRKRAEQGDFREALSEAMAQVGPWLEQNIDGAAKERANKAAAELARTREELDKLKSYLLSKEDYARLPLNMREEQDALFKQFNALNARYYAVATPFYANLYPTDAATQRPVVSGAYTGADLLRYNVAGVLGGDYLFGGRVNHGERIARQLARRRGSEFGLLPAMAPWLVQGLYVVTIAGVGWLLFKGPDIALLLAQTTATLGQAASDWRRETTNRRLIARGLAPLPDAPSAGRAAPDAPAVSGKGALILGGLVVAGGVVFLLGKRRR